MRARVNMDSVTIGVTIEAVELSIRAWETINPVRVRQLKYALVDLEESQRRMLDESIAEQARLI